MFLFNLVKFRMLFLKNIILIKLKPYFQGVLKIFIELLDLNHRTGSAEAQEEYSSVENDNFLILFVIVILVVVFLTHGVRH